MAETTPALPSKIAALLGNLLRHCIAFGYNSSELNDAAIDAARAALDAEIALLVRDAALGKSLREAVMGEAGMPFPLTPIGTLASVVSYARGCATELREQDDDPVATTDLLVDAARAVTAIRAAAARTPTGGTPT